VDPIAALSNIDLIIESRLERSRSEFQRDFRWTDEQVASLIATVISGGQPQPPPNGR